MRSSYLKRQLLLLEMKVADVMRTDVITVTPENKMSELREKFRKYKISGSPVIKDGKLVGIVSIEDLIRWLSEGDRDYTVAETMTRNPICVFPNQPLVHVVKTFEESGYGRFPVTDKENRLVGIISKGVIIEGVLKRLENQITEDEIIHYRASHFFEDIIADHKEIHLSYKIKGKDIESAGSASTEIKKNLKRLGLRPDLIQRLAIASYEAEMNAVLHAEGGTIEYRITPDEICCKVKDSGPGIEDVEKAMQPGFSTASEWIRELGFGAGMGLSNIKKCSDKMDIESTPGKGTTLKIIIIAEDLDEIKRNNKQTRSESKVRQ